MLTICERWISWFLLPDTVLERRCTVLAKWGTSCNVAGNNSTGLSAAMSDWSHHLLLSPPAYHPPHTEFNWTDNNFTTQWMAGSRQRTGFNSRWPLPLCQRRSTSHVDLISWNWCLNRITLHSNTDGTDQKQIKTNAFNLNESKYYHYYYNFVFILFLFFCILSLYIFFIKKVHIHIILSLSWTL